jgi:hypothetical protein
VQCTGGDQWAARDQFLKTAASVYQKAKPSVKAPSSSGKF